MQHVFDVVIVGGGPGGSCAATLLAKKGIRTLVLEKDAFPRFHIGESLLPYNRGIFEEMGVLEKLEAVGFPIKQGAQFTLSNNSKTLKLNFSGGRFTRESWAFQVERAVFDDILLKHAQSCNAEVRHGWIVKSVAHSEAGMKVHAVDPAGQTVQFNCKFVVDASGRSNVTANLEGLRVVHPRLKKIAVFSHFEGVVLDEGPRRGDTLIIRFQDKWFWLIPISATRTSVGCVLDRAELDRRGGSPPEVFDSLWRSSNALRMRLERARAVAPIQTTGDFSYYNRRLVSPGLLRVGDAAGFMDPIFSAGVFLAMQSARHAAQVIGKVLLEGQQQERLIANYQRATFRAMRLYWRMVEDFYETPFIELFLQPRGRFNLPDAITALLAGELEGGFGVAWRKQLFFLLVWLQRRWPLVPRVSFDEGLS